MPDGPIKRGELDLLLEAEGACQPGDSGRRVAIANLNGLDANSSNGK